MNARGSSRAQERRDDGKRDAELTEPEHEHPVDETGLHAGHVDTEFPRLFRTSALESIGRGVKHVFFLPDDDAIVQNNRQDENMNAAPTFSS